MGIPGSGGRSSARRSKCSPASAAFTRCANSSTASPGTGFRTDCRWLFRTYFGAEAEDNEAIEYVARSAACSSSPWWRGCSSPVAKADYMLVLEGDQGILKSSACRALAGRLVLRQPARDIQSKDARQHLRGKWLVEISELAAFSKAETEALKAFITRREERYRPPYRPARRGREAAMPVHRHHQSRTRTSRTRPAAGASGRSSAPAIDVAGLARRRDQLFAEAVVRFRRGERWWPNAAFEKEHIKPEQDDRYEGDPWEKPIADYLAGLIKAHLKLPLLNRGPLETYVLDIARDGLNFDADAKVGTRDQHRIIAILFKQGWRRGKHNERGNPDVRG